MNNKDKRNHQEDFRGRAIIVNQEETYSRIIKIKLMQEKGREKNGDLLLFNKKRNKKELNRKKRLKEN